MCSQKIMEEQENRRQTHIKLFVISIFVVIMTGIIGYGIYVAVILSNTHNNSLNEHDAAVVSSNFMISGF